MASIQRIKGSNGSGNANMATVQSVRSPGATTIVVDTVLDINPTGFTGSMGTPHTFTDPITSETITVISEATCVDFIGHVNSGNLEIDTIAPGYTDLGSQIGDIIIIRPTTQWADNVAAVLGAAHNDDGTLKDNAVAASTIADDSLNSSRQFADGFDPVKRGSELIFDHVASGCVLTGTGYGSTLGWSLTSGVVYIGGKRLTYAGGTGNVSATKDTYFDLHDNGDGTAILVNTGGNIVTVNSASPALASSSVRVGIIQSGVNLADVAHINQGQPDKVLPIASSIPYTVTDSLGNLICCRDPQQKLLGYRQILTSFAGTTNAGTGDDVTGLSVPFIVDGLHKIVAKVSGKGIKSTAGAGATVAVRILESSTELANITQQITTNGYDLNPTVESKVIIPSTGLHTYKVNLVQSAAGTQTLTASSTAPAWVKVERE